MGYYYSLNTQYWWLHSFWYTYRVILHHRFIYLDMKEIRNVLYNNTLNRYYLWFYGIRHIMIKDHSYSEWGNPLPHGLLFQLAAMVLLYESFHRQDNTYHSLCYTSHGALAGMRNSSMGQPWRIDLTTHHTMSERSYHWVKWLLL